MIELSKLKEIAPQLGRAAFVANPKTAPYCISKALINSANGKINDGLVFCGESVSKIKEIVTVKKIIGEFLG